MTTTTTPGRRSAAGMAALLVGAALVAGTLLAGCSSASRSSNAGTAADSAKAPAAAGGGTGNSLAENVPAKGGPAQVPTDQPVQRSIVYTGSIMLQVDDVPGVAAKISSLVTAAGGFVGGDQRDLNADHSTATLTLRIPAEKFGSTLDAIGKDGTEKSRSISTEDVTATVIDLDARIKTQQASVDRMRDLLAKAQSIADVATVEAELSKREADLESMQAKQRNLADLTALSTITVNLLGKDATPPAKPEATGFVGGLQHGWHAFVATVNGLLLVLGALLPFLILLGIALGVVLWVRRRRRAATAPALPGELPALGPPPADPA